MCLWIVTATAVKAVDSFRCALKLQSADTCIPLDINCCPRLRLDPAAPGLL